MNESKTLLTQNEIDTLISFLQSRDETPIGSVLDQGSIDKLVEIIKFNNNNGIFFEKEMSLDFSDESFVSITDEQGQPIDTESYAIAFNKAGNGFINIFCTDEASGKVIPLSPSCLSQKKFVNDDEKWGLAVSPHILIGLSKLFNVKCDAATLSKAEKEFAKLVYGDENATIAEYYLQ